MSFVTGLKAFLNFSIETTNRTLMYNTLWKYITGQKSDSDVI
jgi:hypothetical protein